MAGDEKALNINEEYFSALKTKSYAELFTRAQLLVNRPCSQSYCRQSFTEVLLEPGQETIATILNSFSKNTNLKDHILKFFDLTTEASKICGHILKNIRQIRSNYCFIQRALDKIEDYSDPEECGTIISELSSYITLKNPFTTPNNEDFELIHEEYSSVLHHLNLKRKKVARKMKLIKYFKRASGNCVTAACGLIAIAAKVFTALVLGPEAVNSPIKRVTRKITNFRFLRKSRFIKKVGNQLDVAAKGTYVLNRYFETLSRLVARLHNEIEHNKVMIKFCLERAEDKFSMQEVVKELKKSDNGFRKQVEELEEHVYLCLVTINQARASVIEEMTSSYGEDLKKEE